MNARRSIGAAVIAAALSVGIAPAFAHHSFGLYDMAKTVEVDGTVAKFEWSNPHCWLFLQAGVAGGTDTSYGFEMQSVGEITRRGWKKNALKAGDKIKSSLPMAGPSGAHPAHRIHRMSRRRRDHGSESSESGLTDAPRDSIILVRVSSISSVSSALSRLFLKRVVGTGIDMATARPMGSRNAVPTAQIPSVCSSRS
jgi:hypothetical protein